MTERMGLAAVGRQNRQRAALARRAELRPAARRLAAVAVGFAGGWAVLYGALMPFGLGFVLGFAEDCFAPCAAGAALGVLLHGFGALSLRSVCMLCALGAAVAARWMGARTLTPAALAGCALGVTEVMRPAPSQVISTLRAQPVGSKASVANSCCVMA